MEGSILDLRAADEWDMPDEIANSDLSSRCGLST